jgi:hypothetical protein
MHRIVAAAVVMLAFTAPDRRVAVRTDNEGPYERGAQVHVEVELAEASHLLVVRIDTEGRAGVLLPGQPWDDSAVSGSTGLAFTADDRTGVGYLLAIAATAPFDLTDLSVEGHWDLRSLGGGRVTGDPYQALSRFTARVARGTHDYDVVPYYVGRRYDYPRFVCYDCHGATAPEWDAYERACTRFGLVVYDDPAHYPYRAYDHRAVVPARPLTLAPRYEFRERTAGTPAIVNRQRAPTTDRPASVRPDRGPRGRTDSVRAPQPRRPRSLGEPELRRRPRRD